MQGLSMVMGFPGGSVVEKPPANAGRRCGLDSWMGKIPWRRKWQLTPVFLPEESHEQRSPVVLGSQRVAHDLVTKHILRCFMCIAIIQRS